MTYVMLCGKPPFWGTREQHLKAPRDEKYPIKDPPWNKMHPAAKHFVQTLLKAKPDKRPKAEEVLKLQWLTTAPSESTVDAEASKQIMSNLKNFTAQSTFKRMCITAVARQLDHKHLSEIHQVFREIDENGDGVLSEDEVKKGLKLMMGAEFDEAKFDKVFANLDLDGSRTIDYTEFCAAGLDAKTATQDEVIWAAFKTFDTRNTGYITIDCLKKILSSGEVQESWSTDVCQQVGKEIVDKYDTDGDGQICFDDFRKLMSGCWKDGHKGSKSPTGSGALGAYDLLLQVNQLDVSAVPKAKART